MKNQPFPLTLASRSPSRRRLLAEAGYTFDVLAPRDTAECGICSRETPPELVGRLAYQKAADVAERVDAGWVLACDTLAECRGQMLGKPLDRRHARRMLCQLRGRVHHVYTGICLWRVADHRSRVEVDVTKLRMEPISDEQLQAYLDSGQWQGKSGACGYRDQPGWIRILSGTASNVEGLPLELLTRMWTQWE